MQSNCHKTVTDTSSGACLHNTDPRVFTEHCFVKRARPLGKEVGGVLSALAVQLPDYLLLAKVQVLRCSLAMGAGPC